MAVIGLGIGIALRLGFRLGFWLRFRLAVGAFCFHSVCLTTFAAAVLAGRGRRSRLFGVVVDVPSAAFELDGGRGDHLLDLAAAFRALLQHGIREQLDLLEAVSAFFAFVFV